MLLPGDPAPHFIIASSVNPKFNFGTIAGRYIALSFFGSASSVFAQQVLAEVQRHQQQFDGKNRMFFGVSADADDRQRLRQEHPGIVYFWDDDGTVSRQFGAIADMPAAKAEGSAAPESTNGSVQDAKAIMDGGAYSPRTLILDPALRVLANLPYGNDPVAHVDRVMSALQAQSPVAQLQMPAPVLLVPHVFEPQFCKLLIEYYNTHGGKDSGFMRDVAGKTVTILDHSHKRRADCVLEDQGLIRATQERLRRRLVPAIQQAFQFNATRIERHIVACYDAADGGHFSAHRDNTTAGTAHRRFAVTINLNAEEFKGGELIFPEFGRLRYRPATGAAVVFSCSLLHEATPVSEGRRFAFLPFLYDEASAKVRTANAGFISKDEPIRGSKNALG
jgi:peroxiredoxin